MSQFNISPYERGKYHPGPKYTNKDFDYVNGFKLKEEDLNQELSIKGGGYVGGHIRSVAEPYLSKEDKNSLISTFFSQRDMFQKNITPIEWMDLGPDEDDYDEVFEEAEVDRAIEECMVGDKTYCLNSRDLVKHIEDCITDGNESMYLPSIPLLGNFDIIDNIEYLYETRKQSLLENSKSQAEVIFLYKKGIEEGKLGGRFEDINNLIKGYLGDIFVMPRMSNFLTPEHSVGHPLIVRRESRNRVEEMALSKYNPGDFIRKMLFLWAPRMMNYFWEQHSSGHRSVAASMIKDYYCWVLPRLVSCACYFKPIEAKIFTLGPFCKSSFLDPIPFCMDFRCTKIPFYREIRRLMPYLKVFYCSNQHHIRTGYITYLYPEHLNKLEGLVGSVLDFYQIQEHLQSETHISFRTASQILYEAFPNETVRHRRLRCAGLQIFKGKRKLEEVNCTNTSKIRLSKVLSDIRGMSQSNKALSRDQNFGGIQYNVDVVVPGRIEHTYIQEEYDIIEEMEAPVMFHELSDETRRSVKLFQGDNSEYEVYYNEDKIMKRDIYTGSRNAIVTYKGALCSTNNNSAKERLDLTSSDKRYRKGNLPDDRIKYWKRSLAVKSDREGFARVLTKPRELEEAVKYEDSVFKQFYSEGGEVLKVKTFKAVREKRQDVVIPCVNKFSILDWDEEKEKIECTLDDIGMEPLSKYLKNPVANMVMRKRMKGKNRRSARYLDVGIDDRFNVGSKLDELKPWFEYYLGVLTDTGDGGILDTKAEDLPLVPSCVKHRIKYYISHRLGLRALSVSMGYCLGKYRSWKLRKSSTLKFSENEVCTWGVEEYGDY